MKGTSYIIVFYQLYLGSLTLTIAVLQVNMQSICACCTNCWLQQLTFTADNTVRHNDPSETSIQNTSATTFSRNTGKYVLYIVTKTHQR